MQIKNESGSKVDPGKGGLYKKWKERSHLQISTQGQGDDAHAECSEGGGTGKFSFDVFALLGSVP